MIDETIKIHDKYQFEIKRGYEFIPEQKITSYRIDTYFFLPSSLGINRHSYKKQDFYNDIQAHIRLKTPIVLLQDIVAENESPFKKLQHSLEALVANTNKKTFSNYEYQIKMFCCILKSALRDHVKFVVKKVAPQDVKDLLTKFTTDLSNILLHFRKLRSLINIPTIDEKTFSIYLFGDEYISHLTELHSYKLLEHLRTTKFPEREIFKSELLALIKTEIDYRTENKYPSIPEKDSDNEGLLFRRSVLKKYTENVLFLDTHLKQEGRILEQIIFALAAGVSMIFATGALFFSQYKYGNFTFPVFVILVISYIFKDRIKELTRYYLGNKIQNILFDFKMDIYGDARKKIGWCKESLDFIKESKIPKKIIKIRNRDHITEIENDWLEENILLYRKAIKIFARKFKFKKSYYEFPSEGINDIIRLNVSKFLHKMDDPKKLFYICEDQDYYKIYGERVYHLTMIVKYSFQDTTLYKRFRIVLNRDGIKRIEEVPVHDIP